MVPAQRSLSPAPTVTQSSASRYADASSQTDPPHQMCQDQMESTPPDSMPSASYQTEPLKRMPRNQSEQWELEEMNGCDDLPPHCLDQASEVPGIQRQEYRWGIQCSMEELKAIINKVGLVKEAERTNMHQALQSHLIRKFNFPSIAVKVAFRRKGQASAAVISIYPNHNKTAALKAMKKRGVKEDDIVGYIQQLLDVGKEPRWYEEPRWYAPVIPGY